MNHLREEEFIHFLDNRLSEVEHRRLAAHLKDCPDCDRRVQEMRDLLGLLEEWPAAGASPGFEAGLRQRLAGQKPATGWFVLRPTYALALAAVALVAVGLVLWQPIGPTAPVAQLPTQSVKQPVTPRQQTQTPIVSATPQASDVGDELATLENPVLLDNYELLQEFDILFEPLDSEKEKL